jgi:hypothetical protein
VQMQKRIAWSEIGLEDVQSSLEDDDFLVERREGTHGQCVYAISKHVGEARSFCLNELGDARLRFWLRERIQDAN